MSFQPVDDFIRFGRPPSDQAARLSARVPCGAGEAGARADAFDWTPESMAFWISGLARWTSWLTFTVDDDKAARLQNRTWADWERALLARSNHTPEAIQFRATHVVRLTEDWLGGQFRWWLTAYNRWANNGAPGYKRRWGHSLFSYAFAFDYGDRLGRLHAHALTTYLDWEVAAQLWRDRIGSFDFEPVGDVIGRSRYLADYMIRRRRSLDFLWIQKRDWSMTRVTLPGPER